MNNEKDHSNTSEFSEVQSISKLNYFEFVNLKKTKYELKIYARDSNSALFSRVINLSEAEAGVQNVGELLLDKDPDELARPGNAFSFGTVVILSGFVYMLFKTKIDGIIGPLMKKRK